ncbi:MAG: hypothetical protein M5U26_16595 [Planctomycetota bacterium]|nr:hypothetical protein [Planctomycetota bacterium]
MADASVPDFKSVLGTLSGAQVEYILVGGLAAIGHGGSRATFDVDVVYSRAPENVARLVRALSPYHPYPRGAPPGLPFQWDAKTLLRGLNFTLTTDLGDLDLLGEIAGGGTYEELLPRTVDLKVFGEIFRCLDLRMLIQVKRAAGRPKDFEALAELEAILEEEERMQTEQRIPMPPHDRAPPP